MSDEINRKSLEEEFDLESTEIEIETFKDILHKAKSIEDPDNLLTSIIEKAGTILDIVEREMANGSVSGKLAEAASNILTVLMNATNSMVNNHSINFNDDLKQQQLEQNNRRLKQRDREIDIKEKEAEIKQIYYQNRGQVSDKTTNNNVIVTDRQSIMKFLQDKKE